MKINKLTASFGKLENETLRLHDGLNVIYAPNESGKSTWCAFILAMLYGVDSSERARAGHIPDKLRYAPWSGAPMEGSMELTADRCDITITRSTRAKNAPMKEFSATYTGTNTPVQGITAGNAGETLTGVTKEVFCRSAFIGQGSVAVTGSPELEKRINAIVSTGEEQTSYSEADERLRAWQRKRRYNRRGMLPELEGRIDETERKLNDMSGSMQDMEALEKRLSDTREECARLEQAVNESRKKQRREALGRLNAGRAETQRCSAEHDRDMEELSRRREELRAGRFAGRGMEQVEQEAEEDIREIERVQPGRGKAGVILPILLFIIAAACAAVFTKVEHIALMIGAVLACFAAVLLLLRFSKAKRAREQVDAERRALLKKYGANSTEEIRDAVEAHRALTDAVLEAEKREKQSRTKYENARTVQAQLEEAALKELDFSAGDSEATRLSRELANARQGAERLAAKIAAINGRVAAIGDPLVLASDLSCMREEYEEISQEYDALSLAIDTLREADGEIQSRFSPELGRVAAGYMSLVTGGRYSDVLLNRDFTARTKARGDSVAREAEYLSSGTLDLLYLAVRLAVCELALPDGESCPLIIDDALVNLDEERLGQAMELLKQIARERQVILFSCRK